MAEADILSPDGNVIGTMTIPEGASQDQIRAMGMRATEEARARLGMQGTAAPAPTDRMPLVTEPLAGEGPAGPQPFWSNGIPRATDLIPNPLDVPGKVARGLGLGPIVDWGNQPQNAIALLMPTSSNPLAAGGIAAATQGVIGAKDILVQRMGQSQAPSTIGRFEDAVKQFSPDDLWNVAARMLVGFGVGAGTAWGVNKLTGRLRANPAAQTVEPSGVRPLPDPTVPTEDQIAAVTARELQMDAKGAAQATVERATGVPVPVFPGPQQNAAVQAIREQVPEPSKETVDTAYRLLRDAYQTRTGSDLVDATDIVESLARARAAIGSRKGTVPTAIDPTDLMVTPQNERPGWLAGVMAPGRTRWWAPIETVQRKLSAINTLKNDAAARAQSGLDVADLSYLAKRAYEGLRGQLSNDADKVTGVAETYLLDQATNAARLKGRLESVAEIIDGHVSPYGVPEGARIAKALLEHKDQWGTRLGDLYDATLTWAQNVAKLQEKEVGAAAVKAITQMAQKDAQAVVQTQAGNTGQALLEAVTPAHGASPTTRGVTEALHGAGIGAAAFAGLGMNPAYGAAAGASGVGIGALYSQRMLDPLFRRGFDALARHPAGSQAFMQTLGRLGLLTYDSVAPLQPEPSGPTPLPLPTPTPAPLGRVGAP